MLFYGHLANQSGVCSAPAEPYKRPLVCLLIAQVYLLINLPYVPLQWRSGSPANSRDAVDSQPSPGCRRLQNAFDSRPSAIHVVNAHSTPTYVV